MRSLVTLVSLVVLMSMIVCFVGELSRVYAEGEDPIEPLPMGLYPPSKPVADNPNPELGFFEWILSVFGEIA